MPFMKESIPLLPVRLAECMLGIFIYSLIVSVSLIICTGRFAPVHLLVVFPAHILGGIVGVALLQIILPNSYSQVRNTSNPCMSSC